MCCEDIFLFLVDKIIAEIFGSHLKKFLLEIISVNSYYEFSFIFFSMFLSWSVSV